jgi:lipoprotein signal peptidase
MRRIAIVLALALPLTTLDLVWKDVANTPDWSYHTRSPAWLAISILLVLGAFALARIRSAAVLVTAGVMAGGVLGNALSGAWNELRIPNPIVVSVSDALIAFNPADVFTMFGIFGLTAALAVTLVRNRHALPTRQEAWARWARASQRRF